MKHLISFLLVVSAMSSWAQSATSPSRLEAEYYITAYAQHYRVPWLWSRRLWSANLTGAPAQFHSKALWD